MIGSGVGVTMAAMMKITIIAWRRYFRRKSVVITPSQTSSTITKGNSKETPTPSVSQVTKL